MRKKQLPLRGHALRNINPKLKPIKMKHQRDMPQLALIADNLNPFTDLYDLSGDINPATGLVDRTPASVPNPRAPMLMLNGSRAFAIFKTSSHYVHNDDLLQGGAGFQQVRHVVLGQLTFHFSLQRLDPRLDMR